ncbi:MAG: alpha/beta fold hydrolase [Gemmatimonadales bacterium]
MSDQLRILRGGEGDPVLVLLHGMGATSDVWDGLRPVLAAHWPGRWLAPDLPGHGGSAPLSSYSFGQMAAVIASALPPSGRLAVLGHSLGGVVALTLASGWFGVPVAAVCGLGIKVAWTADELARARALATRPHLVYPTRAEAAERHLKVAGLGGLVAAADFPPEALIQRDGGWALAFDPAAFAMGAPDMAGLIAASRAAVVLAAGERDPMCPLEGLAALVPTPVILPGLGHNAHVEHPAALIPILAQLAG